MEFTTRYRVVAEKKENNTKINKEVDNMLLNQISNATSQYLSAPPKTIKQKVSYKPIKADYNKQRTRQVNDTTRNIPVKQIAFWPKSWMGGILGLTVLGWDWVAIRDDQHDKEFQYVDTHECIHTEDEYETRILTDWVLSKKRDNYIR